MEKLLSMVSENVTHAYNVIHETVNGTVVRIWLYADFPAPTAPTPPAVPAPIPLPTPWLAIIIVFVATSIVMSIIVWWYGYRR